MRTRLTTSGLAVRFLLGKGLLALGAVGIAGGTIYRLSQNSGSYSPPGPSSVTYSTPQPAPTFQPTVRSEPIATGRLDPMPAPQARIETERRSNPVPSDGVAANEYGTTRTPPGADYPRRVEYRLPVSVDTHRYDEPNRPEYPQQDSRVGRSTGYVQTSVVETPPPYQTHTRSTSTYETPRAAPSASQGRSGNDDRHSRRGR
jgi:hypothetical protein